MLQGKRITESQSKKKPEELRSQQTMLRLRPCMLEVIKRAHLGDPTVPSCSCILVLSDKARRFTVTLLFYPHCISNEATLERSELRAVPGLQPSHITETLSVQHSLRESPLLGFSVALPIQSLDPTKASANVPFYLPGI